MLVSNPNGRGIAIDPGLKGLGVAVFYRAELVKCSFVEPDKKVKRNLAAWRKLAHNLKEEYGTNYDWIVVESQQIYSRGKARPSDIMELRGISSMILGMYAHVPEQALPLPREWKGQLPPEVLARRVDARLCSSEHKRITETRKGRLLDIKHAIGLGLCASGRGISKVNG